MTYKLCLLGFGLALNDQCFLGNDGDTTICSFIAPPSCRRVVSEQYGPMADGAAAPLTDFSQRRL